MKPRVKVLAVMGSGRAGSTLLDTLLGSIDGFFSAGELRYVWSREAEAPRCGCGSTLADCQVWGEVMDVWREDADRSDHDRAVVQRWQHDLGRTRHTRSLLRADRRRTRSAELRGYLAAMNELYVRIAEVSGASVIVDSSKRPSDAALLRLLPDVDPWVVQLVRDPRAVAYSWQRQKRDPGSNGSNGGRMPNRSAVLSTGVWVELNSVGHLVRRQFGPERSRFVRYEDFVEQPRAVVADLLEMLGETGEPPFTSDGRADLRPNHTVGGNPNRFATGPIEIRSDDVWKDELASVDSWTCSALAAPLNAVYGYPIRPGSDRPRSTRSRASRHAEDAS